MANQSLILLASYGCITENPAKHDAKRMCAYVHLLYLIVYVKSSDFNLDFDVRTSNKFMFLKFNKKLLWN